MHIEPSDQGTEVGPVGQQPGGGRGDEVADPLVADRRQQPGGGYPFHQLGGPGRVEPAQLHVAAGGELDRTLAELAGDLPELDQNRGRGPAAGDPQPDQQPVLGGVGPQEPRAAVSQRPGVRRFHS